MLRPPLFDIQFKVYTKIGTSSFALPCGRFEFAKFNVSQIKRQFNVFPLCLPSAYSAFGKAKKRKKCWTGEGWKRKIWHKNKTGISFHLTIPKITSGAMVISVKAQKHAPMCMKCQNGTSNSLVFLSSISITPDQDLN